MSSSLRLSLGSCASIPNHAVSFLVSVDLTTITVHHTTLSYNMGTKSAKQKNLYFSWNPLAQSLAAGGGS